MGTCASTVLFLDLNDTRQVIGQLSADPGFLAEVSSAPGYEEGWRAGFLAGRKVAHLQCSEEMNVVQLARRICDWENDTSVAISHAATEIASLLIDAVVAAVSDQWGTKLPERASTLANDLQKALRNASDVMLVDADGNRHRLDEVAEQVCPVTSGYGDAALALSWTAGEARMSRSAVLSALTASLSPLVQSGSAKIKGALQ